MNKHKNFVSSILPSSLPSSECSETYYYDVVVVGAGTSGVPAAYAANESGAKVACIQKQGFAVSQGLMGSGIDLERSTPQGVQRFMKEFNQRAGWRADLKLLAQYIYHSGETIDWLKNKANSIGCEITAEFDNVFEYENGEKCVAKVAVFGPKPQDYGRCMRALAKAGANEGIDFFYSTRAISLVKSSDRVTGVITVDRNGVYTKFVASKGVILATGDYQNNPEMVKQYCPDAVNFDKKQYGKTGDGHLMGMSAGAIMEPVGHTKMLHDFDSGPMYDEPFLAVDAHGERFMNEETVFEYVNNLMRYRPKRKGKLGYYSQIFDSTYFEQVNEWGGSPVPLEFLMKYVKNSDTPKAAVREDLIDTHVCDTLDELAEALDLNAETLKESVARYNELCEKGVDEDFGKLSQYMKPIKKAPFFGIRKHLRVSSICSGLLVNENFQCYDKDHNLIPGLFAVGNTSGQFSGATDWVLYSGGMCIGYCLTSGRISGKYVASLPSL